MKKLLPLIAVSFLFITGCSTQEKETKTVASSSKVETVKVEVSIYKDDTDKIEKTVEAEKGENLLDLMTSEFNAKDDNGFITEINGWAQDAAAGKYWMFKVNGEDSMVGAKEVEVKADDVYAFRLEEMK